MKLPVWTESIECLLGINCVTCRSTSASGYRWRASLAKVFCLPKAADPGRPDIFRCPHGEPLDAKAGQQREMPKGAALGGCGCSPPPRVE